MDDENTFGGKTQKTYIIESTGNGVAVFDYDGDGFNDIFIANGTTLAGEGRPSFLYHNDGKGKFTLVGDSSGMTKRGWAQGVCAGDYDNDGRTDLLVTYYGTNVLYRNLGNGRFEDATKAAGLPVQGVRWGAGCSFTDYDRDGKLDLFVSNYVDLDLSATPKPGQDPTCQFKGLPTACGPRGLPAAANVLYHNNGDGTFTDVSAQAGILKPGRRYGLGVAAADFDNDGWPDIYVACDMTPSLLYHNLGNGKFEERAVEAGVAYNFDGKLQAGMGIAVGDYDGNGFLDIAKTNFSGDLTSLFKNEDGRFFTDVSQDAGLAANQLLGWGALFLDVDNDGWKDLIVANGHVYPEVEQGATGEKYLQRTLLYRNLSNGKFGDITREAGPGFQQLRPARGMAAGDLDGDGNPEVVIVNMNAKPSVLTNSAKPQNFINLRLVGTKSNRSAIGSRVTVQTGTRKQIDEVMSGGSFFSQSDLTLHIGLGAAKLVDRVQVRWPSGLTQEWKSLPGNALLTLTEGDPKAATRQFPIGPE
ncbi:MAG: CRTAC1 family protein [Bryobacteraceae bacterium]